MDVVPPDERTRERHAAVHRLLEQGHGLLECARRLGWALNTVKRYVRVASAEELKRLPRYRRHWLTRIATICAAAMLRNPAWLSPGCSPKWMTCVDADDQPALHGFVYGLRMDLSAVIGGLTMPYSNGPIEDANTKVKFLKRQMYGRAVFDLLR